MRDGEALLAFGVMGAAMQPQGQVQVLSNMLDFGMGLQAAGDAPRVRHEGSTEPTGAPPLAGGGTVHLEPGFDAAAIEGLRARGHRIEPDRQPRARSAAIKRSGATCARGVISARPSRAKTVTPPAI